MRPSLRAGATRPDARLGPRSIDVLAAAIGPIRTGQGLLWLRPPTVLDGLAWRETCLRESDRLSHVLGSPALSWSDSISLAAWVERVGAQRSAVRAGLLVPYVAALDDGRIMGELSFAIDPRTRVAEASLWISQDVSREARAWLIGMALLRAFSLPDRIDRIIAPVASSNAGPGALFAALGFTRAVHSEQLRWYDGRWADHDIWWLDAGPELLSHLGRVLMIRTSSAEQTTEPSVSGPVRSSEAWRAMALAWARARVRAIRRWRPPSPRGSSAVHGEVSFPLGRPGPLMVSGQSAGLIDVRHDPGTSTVEIWTAMVEGVPTTGLAPALENHARALGARRMSWILMPDSADQDIARSAGFRPEGSATPPIWAEQTLHESWAKLL